MSEARRVAPLRVIGLGLLVAGSLALCGLALWRGWVTPHSIQDWVRRSGSLAMLVYVGAVVLLEFLWIPRVWGLLAAGILFGPLLGALLSLLGDLLGALLCYALARGAARDWVQSLLEHRPRARRIVELLAERRSVLTLALLRSCPAAHFTLVSYAAGLAGVRPGNFLLGTGLGLLPGAVIYPTMGDAALRPGSPLFYISLAAVVVILGVTLWMGRRLLRESPSSPRQQSRGSVGPDPRAVPQARSAEDCLSTDGSPPSPGQQIRGE